MSGVGLVVERLAARLLVVDGGPGPWRRQAGVLAFDVRFGASDDRALAVQNVVVGNRWHTPALELFVGALTLRVEAPLTLATDGLVSAGDVVLPSSRALRLVAGQQIAITPRALCCTIAVAGGVDAIPGAVFSRDDAIPLRHAAAPIPPEADIDVGERTDDDAPLRVVPGPERSAFDDGAWRALLETTWTVSPTSSRLGVRLTGPALVAPTLSMTTAPAWTGAVQVTPSGQPIVLGVDSRTTGGYPRLAHVIAVDRFRLGRARPGSALRFTAIDLDEARALRQARERSLR